METNVEDNVHKLRLRLIDSELNHQRQSSNEYLKRTQKQIALSSPTPIESSIQNIRPPSALVQRQLMPKIRSRQSNLSPISVTDDAFGDRFAMEPDLQLTSDLERDLEIRQIQESLNNVPKSRQSLTISNYPYDPRVHLYQSNDARQFSSSNMDDLIDSMARRHLAQRRLDVAIEQQRRMSGLSAPYIHPVAVPRSPLVPNEYIYPRRPSNLSRVNSNSTFTQLLRSRIDYYHRLEMENEPIEDTFRGNPYPKLPPISPSYDPRRFYASLNSQREANLVRPYPVNDRHEHLIELPSDIFLASQSEIPNSSHRRPFSKARTDRSEVEIDLSTIRRQASHQSRNSPDADQGFFTETIPTDAPIERSNNHRNLFKRTALVALFLITLRRRAIKSRSRHVNPSASAAIHKIRLQEIIVALHRVYLEPDGPIYNSLIQSINHPLSFKDGLNKSSNNYSQAIELIGDSLRNIIGRIVDFMPRDGVVGTGTNSAIAILLQDGNPFPENYFWHCERALLEFNGTKVINITKYRATLLILGIFIFRSLVTTLLIKPIKYRLILGSLTPTQAENLKVLATLILYVARRAVGVSRRILPMPEEWQLSLHRDETMMPIIEHAEIQPVIKTCEESLRQWCEEYIRRIDANYGKELRM